MDLCAGNLRVFLGPTGYRNVPLGIQDEPDFHCQHRVVLRR